MTATRRPYTVPQSPDPASMVAPGQHVITASGVRAVVAFVRDGVVHAWVGMSPMPRPCIVRGDAWGGEMDMSEGLDRAA